MTTYGTITGRLDGACVLHGTLEARGQLTGTLTLPTLTPPVHPSFDGPYEVTPRFHEQTLKTKNKLMTDDVTVETIPVYRTINPSGGNTVSIGI